MGSAKYIHKVRNGPPVLHVSSQEPLTSSPCLALITDAQLSLNLIKDAQPCLALIIDSQPCLNLITNVQPCLAFIADAQPCLSLITYA